MIRFKGLFLLVFFPFLENSSAQEVLEINSLEQANEQIENYIDIYVDTTNALDLSQILNRKEENLFSPLKQFAGKRSPKHTYWLFFSIENNFENFDLLGLFIPLQNHQVDIFSFTDTVLYKQKTGFYMDAGNNNEIIPCSNTIPVKHAGKTDFYLKIKNINDELPAFSITFVDLEKRIERINHKVFFSGIAQGIMCLMILYGLILFFFKKDKVYLYYSVYIVFSIVYYFFILGYGYNILPGLPREISDYAMLPIFLGFVFYTQFLRLFINTSQVIPRWDILLKLFLVLFVIESIRIPVFVYSTNLVVTNSNISNGFSIVIQICSIIFIIKLFTLKSKLINIIAIGNSLLILGFLFGTILIFLNNNSNGGSFIRFAILSELIVFTYGITYRYSLIEAEKQKFQKQLIVQLNQNAELHEKVNRELADKVKERTLEIEKQKDHIEKINTDITDSINYAKYIQSSILPKEDQMQSCLGEHFIFYKPKDIVSGDFYWISNIEGKTIIAAVDCTGHGVPGAFMSMLGTALLNEIVNKEYITHPGVILRHLRKDVINSLQQKGKRGEQKDGMDIALCTLDLENMKLQFAGANNPLYLIRKSNLEKVGVLRCDLSGDFSLYEIKGDPMPIGISDRMDSFTLHEIDIYKGDSLYLFTDGLPDQFGGPLNKKFGYRQFREQLLKTSPATMPDQKILLETALNEWKGDNSQIDDILVVGFRFN